MHAFTRDADESGPSLNSSPDEEAKLASSLEEFLALFVIVQTVAGAGRNVCFNAREGATDGHL